MTDIIKLLGAVTAIEVAAALTIETARYALYRHIAASQKAAEEKHMPKMWVVTR